MNSLIRFLVTAGVACMMVFSCMTCDVGTVDEPTDTLTDFRMSDYVNNLLEMQPAYAATYLKAKQLGASPADGKVPVANATGGMDWETLTEAGFVPPGSDTWVVYNDGGAWGAEAAFAYDDATDVLAIDNAGSADTILSWDVQSLYLKQSTANPTTDTAMILLHNNLDSQDSEQYFIAGITGTAASVNEFYITRTGSAYFDGIITDDPLYIEEQANTDGDAAGYGQFWVKNTTPNTPWFTDDAGTDMRLGNVNTLYTVESSTANSGGGYKRMYAEATSGALAGATGDIQVNIPTGSRLLGCQLRVDTAITGATLWSAAYTAGGFVQAVATHAAQAKNTKVNTMYNTNAASDIAIAEVDIDIATDDFNFTGGVVRAIVYYEIFIAMDDNP